MASRVLQAYLKPIKTSLTPLSTQKLRGICLDDSDLSVVDQAKEPNN